LVNVVKVFLESKNPHLDVNVALLDAVLKGDAAVVKTLLKSEYQLEVNSPVYHNGEKTNLLDFALDEGYEDIIRAFLKSNRLKVEAAFTMAVKIGDADLVKEFFDSKNSNLDLTEALDDAVEQKNADVVRILLESDFIPKNLNKNFLITVKKGSVEVLRAFLASKYYDLLEISEALNIASKKGKDDIITILTPAPVVFHTKENTDHSSDSAPEQPETYQPLTTTGEQKMSSTSLALQLLNKAEKNELAENKENEAKKKSEHNENIGQPRQLENEGSEEVGDQEASEKNAFNPSS
jgi:hypothetical protein